MSWIWLVLTTSNANHSADAEASNFADAMRAEWAQTKARADRWSEEKQLVQEEMRRVLAYFQWKAN